MNELLTVKKALGNPPLGVAVTGIANMMNTSLSKYICCLLNTYPNR